MKKKLKFIMVIFLLSCTGYAKGLTEGNEYKIIKPVYLIANYNSRSNKTVSKETAEAFLAPNLRAQKSYTAFQSEVPRGTIMTIIGKAPKPWYLYFQGEMYFVKLDPDLSQGLDIIIQLDRGIEGNLDGLNSEIFERM